MAFAQAMTAPPNTRLALFDLDNTLLTGDTDVYWCDFLIQHGVLDGATFAISNADMDRRYRSGQASAVEYCEFYVSLLRGITLADGEILRQQFFTERILPNISDDARALVEKHRADGDALILTTATNRFITELTAREFSIEHLIAIETEVKDGLFTGKTQGVLNMREGKVTRLAEWLDARGWEQSLMSRATFYSDSINDLPLLSVVGKPVLVDPDVKLRHEASARTWPMITLRRAH